MADAQPSDAAPTTAVEAAVVSNDFAAFEAAERAALAGKPLNPPAPKAADPDPDHDPAATAAPVLSKRQQDLNDRIKKATDAVAAAKDAEIASLRAQIPAPRPAAPATAPVAPKPEGFPTFAQFVEKKPDASLEDYLDARDEFRETQRERATAARSEQQSVEAAEQARMTKAAESVQARIATDPDFASKLNPRLLEIETFADAGRNGRATGPANVIAEELFKSDHLVPLLEHFTAHPEALAALEAMPPAFLALPPRQRVAEHARWIVRSIGQIEASLSPASAAAEAHTTPKQKTVSRAPAPPADLGKRQTDAADPSRSAVQADDYAAFEAAERAKLVASMRR